MATDSAKTGSDSASLLPKAPSDLKAAVIGPATIRLDWNVTALLRRPGEASEARSLRIYRQLAGAALTLIGQVAPRVASFIDHLPSGGAGAVITYAIEAVNEKGASERVTASIDPAKAAVDTAEKQQLEEAASKAAIDLKAALKSSNTVLLSWTGLLAGHRYQIRRQVGDAFPSIIAAITGTMSQYLDRLPSAVGGRVAYFIEDLDGKGASNQALIPLGMATIDSAKGTITSTDPSSKGPSNLSATLVAPGTVRLDWTLPSLAPVAGQAMPFIRIYRRLEGGALALIATLDPGLASFIDHLQAGVMNATYAIEAVYEKGASPQATVSIDPRKDRIDSAGAAGDTAAGKGAAANPVPKGPSDVTAVLSAPNTVTLTWNAVPDATFEIRRSIGGGIGQVIARIASGTGQYTDQLPPPGDKDNTVLYRISVANDKRAAPVMVTIDPVEGTSQTIEDQGLDSLPRVRGKVP